MVKTVYLAYFGDLGYYASYQPNYEWSFTDNILLAKEYTTARGASERIRDGIHLYKTTGEIITVEISINIVKREQYKDKPPVRDREQEKYDKLCLKANRAREEYIKTIKNENDKTNVTRKP